jgi:hypothetical protein
MLNATTLTGNFTSLVNSDSAHTHWKDNYLGGFCKVEYNG